MSDSQHQQHSSETASNAAILHECEAQFRENDSVLNMNIFKLLKTYIKAGGKPATVVELLSSNYKGYMHMTSLICSWLAYVLCQIIIFNSITKLFVQYGRFFAGSDW